MTGINVLSLFDGMATGRVALERANIPVANYFASEVDPYAIAVSKRNYPDIVQVGDVTKLTLEAAPRIDLLLAGSPCQGFSFQGKQLNFDDPRSALFFNFLAIYEELKRVNPGIKFLLENVNMSQQSLDVISSALGVQPVLIDSALVSGQSRKRYYWSNIANVTVPEDKGISLQSLIEGGGYSDRQKSYCLVANQHKGSDLATYFGKSRRQMIFKDEAAYRYLKKVFDEHEAKGIRYSVADNLEDRKLWRDPSVLECERLQTMPEGYTEGVSKSQRLKMLGNGWTCDVIVHLLKLLQKEMTQNGT